MVLAPARHRRRDLRSGSYLAGTIWPLVIQNLAGSIGWRSTYSGIGVFCLATMLPLILRSAPAAAGSAEPSAASVARDGRRCRPGHARRDCSCC